MKLFVLTLLVALTASAPVPDEDVLEPVELVVNGVPDGEPIEISHIVDLKLNQHVDGQLAAETDLLHPYTAVGIAAAAAAAAAATPVAAPEAPATPVEISPPEISVVPEGVVLPAPALPEVTPEVVPESVVLPVPALPEVIPEGIVLPAPASPEVAPEIGVPEGIVLPAPASPEVVPEIDAPEGIILPAPASPEVVPEIDVPEGIVNPAPIFPELVEVPVAPVAEIESPVPSIPVGEIINDGVVQVTINAPEDDSYIAALSTWFSLVLNYFSNGLTYSQQIV